MVRWNLAAVVGVPGVGKTSLCRLAAHSLGYNYVNYGELMLRIAKDEKMASNMEVMFKLPLDLQHMIWRRAASIIRDQKKVLVDLHGLDRSSEGYLISLPLEIISPEIIIIIESSYENIMKRRSSDPDKPRPLEDRAKITEQMELLRTSMAVCSVFLGSYFNVLENNDFKVSLENLKTLLSG